MLVRIKIVCSTKLNKFSVKKSQAPLTSLESLGGKKARKGQQIAIAREAFK